MAGVVKQTEPGLRLSRWLKGSFIFIALLISARFVLEIAGTPQQITRYLSSASVIYLVAIYLGAIAPLRGVQKPWQIVLPGVLLAAWTQGWVILFTIISAAFRLQRSHFAGPQEWGNWQQLSREVFAHLAEIVPVSLVLLVMIAAMLVLWHWPITVGPGAVLGALVVIRFWSEAMNLSPLVSSAWSSSVAFLLCGLFLGGVGITAGLESARRFFVPALVIGWAWRFWILVAVLMAASSPNYTTHFNRWPHGYTFYHLLGFVGIHVIIEGFVAGLVEWGIAVWTANVLRAGR